MTKKHILKAAAFLLLFALIYQSVSKVFSRPGNNYNYHMIAGFYEEPAGSLDAVYIGSSNCFTFWNSAAAWDDHGIAVYPYACDDLPFVATPYLITEARRTQPDALYIVNLNTLHDTEIDVNLSHYLLSGIPMSANKLALIHRLAETAGSDWSERMALYFPIVQFHSRWSELTTQDLSFQLDGMKGAIDQYFYTNNIIDISSNYTLSEEAVRPEDLQLALLEELLDYADSQQVRLLFVLVPRAERSQEDVGKYLYMIDLIEARGYSVVDALTDPEALKLDLTSDFYNNFHTNIHGSMKFTNYLSRYLIDTYGFTDKRGQAGYESWDKAREKYAPTLASNVLDIEHPGFLRTTQLPAPQALEAAAADGSVSLTWDGVDGAEGYCVYSRDGFGSWQRIAEVTGTEYADLRPLEAQRTYRVVPFRLEESGQPCYGHFSYTGVSVQP